MKKETYNFDMKRKYHGKLEEFIAHTLRRKLGDPATRKYLKVACFPGHEGLEVLNVYDRLGIERENIVGIEADEEAADELEALNLGIRIFRGLDYEFFEQEHEGFPTRFDVVNLDYQGYMDDNKCYTLKLLVGRPVLKPVSVLGTNFLGKREVDHRYGAAVNNLSISHLNRLLLEADAKRDEGEIRRLSEEIEKIVDFAQEAKIGDARSDGITTSIINILGAGKDPVELLPIKRELINSSSSSSSSGESVKTFKTFLKRYDAATTQRERTEILWSAENIMLSDLLMAEIQAIVRQSQIANVMPSVGESADAVACYLLQPLLGFHKAVRLYRGKYISDNGAPMLFDLFHVMRYDVTAWEKRPEVAVYDGRVGVYLPVEPVEIVQFVANVFRPQARTKFPPIAEFLPSRELLGSSYGTKQKKVGGGLEIITRLEALELLGADCTPEEIAECYKRFTVDELDGLKLELRPTIENKEIAYAVIRELRDSGVEVNTGYLKSNYVVPNEIKAKLPAYIAHDTMRRKKEGTAVIKRKKVNGQEVIDALANLTPEEVKRRMGLTDGQLSAIMAHKTMGRYQPPLESFRYGGLTFEGRGNVAEIVTRLERRFGNIDDIPGEHYTHHGITVIE